MDGKSFAYFALFSEIGLVLLVTTFGGLLLGHWLDSSVILGVVLINAIIGFIQEGKAEKAMDAIRRMLAPRASVLRDGVRQTVDGEALVPGDLVLLYSDGLTDAVGILGRVEDALAVTRSDRKSVV